MSTTANYVQIYRAFETDALVAEIASMRTQLANPFSSQSSDGQSATRSLQMIAERLTGATQALAERQGKMNSRVLVTFTT